MATTIKRTPFNPAGPFLAKKNFSVFETAVSVNDKLDADIFFPRMHERRVEQLFDAHYIDMATPDDKRAKHLADFPGTSALDRDGDGKKGGSLSRIEKAALKEAGLSVADWLKLPEPERTGALAEAMSLAGKAEASPPPGETGEQGADASGGGDGPAGVAEAQKQAPVAAYKHFGFGQWYAIDKDGNKLGEKLPKATAAGLAAQAGVPVLGVLDSL